MSTSTSSSYIFPSSQRSSQPSAPESYTDVATDEDEIDSLPSSADSSDLSSDDGSQSDAQKEWEASLQQLELLLTMVLVPYVGKYVGRKFAYWSESSELCRVGHVLGSSGDVMRGLLMGSVLKVMADANISSLQVGQNTWNGCMPWKCVTQIRPLSMRLELLKLRHHYRIASDQGILDSRHMRMNRRSGDEVCIRS
jgi:hypothetical protein